LPWKKKLGFENKVGNLCLPWKKKLGFENKVGNFLFAMEEEIGVIITILKVLASLERDDLS
jgi:hypothetical protein